MRVAAKVTVIVDLRCNLQKKETERIDNENYTRKNDLNLSVVSLFCTNVSHQTCVSFSYCMGITVMAAATYAGVNKMLAASTATSVTSH